MNLRILTTTLFLIGFHTTSYAYMTLAETAEIPRQNQLIVGAYPQVFLNEGGGLNIGGFADYALTESVSIRGLVEFGKIDFVLGTSVKFTPFPDIDKQPAIGFRGGFTYARDESENSISSHIAVLLSKKVDTDQGLLNPYVGIPLTFTTTKDSNKTGTQFIAGSEFSPNEQTQMKFGAEAGISLKDSYSYILGFMTYSFDR